MTHNTANHEIKYATKIAPGFTLLNSYVTMHTPTLIRCSKCNLEWSPTPTNFLRRIKCKFCENKTIKKSEITPNMLKIAGIPAILYILHIENKSDTFDRCVKVGISTRDLKYRLSAIISNLKEKYTVTVINSILGDLEYIKYLERHILKKLKYYNYIIDIPFGGETELISYIGYPKLLEILSKHGHNI
jgi:hypothetical protein